MGNLFICYGIIVDSFYIITHDLYHVNNFVLEIEPAQNALPLKRKIPSTNEAYLRHLHFGHINSKRIQGMVNDKLLDPSDFKDYPVYESCLEDKITKRSFSVKCYRAFSPIAILKSIQIRTLGHYRSLRLWDLTNGH
jgi:hypothetical protein